MKLISRTLLLSDLSLECVQIEYEQWKYSDTNVVIESKRKVRKSNHKTVSNSSESATELFKDLFGDTT